MVEFVVMTPNEFAEWMDSAWGDWFADLEGVVKQQNANLAVRRRASDRAEAIAILRSVENDEAMRRYLEIEASVEAAKRVLLGYYKLHVLMGNADHPEAIEIAGRFASGPGFRELCLLCAEHWSD